MVSSTACPGSPVCSAWSIEREVPVVVLSGTGEPSADFARVSTAGLDVVESARVYLTMGGDQNLGECIRFLADRLLLTGYGSAPPLIRPNMASTSGSRERDDRDWEQRRDPRADGSDPLLSGTCADGNVAFIDELVDALEQRGDERAGDIHVEPAGKRRRRRASRPALAIGRCDVRSQRFHSHWADGYSEPSIFERSACRSSRRSRVGWLARRGRSRREV